jgi:hypothetical protein
MEGFALSVKARVREKAGPGRAAAPERREGS